MGGCARVPVIIDSRNFCCGLSREGHRTRFIECRVVRTSSLAVPSAVGFGNGSCRMGRVSCETFVKQGSLRGVGLPRKVVDVGGKTFLFYRGLEAVMLPGAMGRVRGRTFGKYAGLEAVIVPPLMGEVCTKAFSKYSGLAAVIFLRKGGGLRFHGGGRLCSLPVGALCLKHLYCGSGKHSPASCSVFSVGALRALVLNGRPFCVNST